MGNFTLTKKAIKASGTTIENEPIIKSDGDGEVMQWIPSDGVVADGITIDEPGAGNPLRVGIGTISPTVALDVVGAISNTVRTDTNLAADVGVLSATTLDNSAALGLSITVPTSNVAAGDGVGIALGITGRGRSYIANKNTSANLDASNLSFWTEDGGVIHERLVIDTSGNVGIGGDGAPFGKLEVAQATAFTTVYNASVDNIVLTRDATTGSGNFGGSIGFSPIDSPNERMAAIASVQTAADTNQMGLALFTHPSSTGGDPIVEALRIDHNGNVGIGEDTPSFTPNWLPSGTKLSIKASSGGALFLERTAASNPRKWGIGIDTSGSFRVSDDTGSTAPLAISSAGKTSLTPGTDTYGLQITSSNANAIRIDSTATTNVAAIQAHCDTLTTGRLAYFYSNSADTSSRELLTVVNNNALAVNTVCIKATGGGIVETGGVLKENLLTNSGFDVWSNSTLEVAATFSDDDCADDSTSNWTDVGAGSALTFDTDHYELTRNAGDARSFDTITALTVGKLYKLSIDIKDGTASSQNITFGCSTGDVQPAGDESTTETTTSSFVTHTKVFEADAAFTRLYLWVNANLGGNNVEVKDISLTEVTPGCVAADALGPDGWFKDSTLDLSREHSGTNTKDGSFYSLKCGVTTAYDYVAWPLAAVRQTPTWLDRFAGRTVTFGAWFKTSTADHVYFDIYDGADYYSDYHTGGGDWEWIEKTVTISATPTYLMVQILGKQAAGDFYISQPMLVFGSAIGSGNYSRPMGEVVDFENASWYLNSFNGSQSLSSGSGTPSLEAESDGKIPKGAKAVYLQLGIRDSGSASGGVTRVYLGKSAASKIELIRRNDGVPDGAWRYNAGRVGCDSNGDIYYDIDATGSSTLDARIAPSAVQLR